MKDNLLEKDGSIAAEPIVITDECGDSLWDAVLAQQNVVSELNGRPKSNIGSESRQTTQ